MFGLKSRSCWPLAAMRWSLEQRRVVQPQCARLLGVESLVQPRCAVVRLEERGAVGLLLFQQRCAGLCLSSGSCSASMRSVCRRWASLVQPRCAVVRLEERGAVGLLLFQQRCAGLLEQQ